MQIIGGALRVNTYISKFLFSVGHCHPHVVSVGQEQMSKLVTCPGFLSECQVEYAKRIIESLPEKLCVCYFVNSG